MCNFTKLTLLKVSGMLSLQQGDHKVRLHTGDYHCYASHGTQQATCPTAVLFPPIAVKIIVFFPRIYVFHETSSISINGINPLPANVENMVSSE